MFKLVRPFMSLFAVLVLPSSVYAQSSDAIATCKALEPTAGQDVSESFKGKIDGKLTGLASRLAGGVAQLEGEYAKIIKDTVQNYQEGHKLYIWQRLIYMSCVNSGANVDINDLLQAYMVGPNYLNLNLSVKTSDVEIKFIGWDHQDSDQMKLPGESKIPDLVFSIQNISKKEVTVSHHDCALVNFSVPPDWSSRYEVEEVSGTARMSAVGEDSVVIPSQEKKLKSYSIFSLGPLSLERRATKTSVCTFHVGNGTISQPKFVDVHPVSSYYDE